MTQPLSETDRVLHLLNRFSLGPTPDLVDQVREVGIRPWLDAQIEAPPAIESGLAARLAELRSIDLTTREIVDTYNPGIPKDATPQEEEAIYRRRRVPFQEVRARILFLAAYSPAQVREAAADFFRNHFSISGDKGAVRYYATEYERDVIHGRVFGAFGDMLSASAKHPAMLFYLDNFISRRPPTKAELKAVEMRERLRTKSKEQGRTASSIAAQRGLNENYARELLELHTLGVDNHYTQEDVVAVARALTGWTIRRGEGEPIEFEFDAKMHEDGDKKVLRRVIKEDWKNPVSEGEEVLALLTDHPGTADYLSWKLCRHFVNDHPDPAMVKRVSKVFKQSDGDLPSVYRAIVDDPGFFAPENYRAKFKRPFEFVVSALRATGAKVQHTHGLVRDLKEMDEALLECKDPTGYYDQAEAWLDPGALAVRWRFALRLAEGRVDGVRIPATFFEEVPVDHPEWWKEWLLQRLLPSGADARLSDVLDRVVAEGAYKGGRPDPRKVLPRLIGMILGSPGFQKQ